MTTDRVRVPCPLCGGSASRAERALNGFHLERCTGCGFVFCNPQMTDEALNQLYAGKDIEKTVQLYSNIASPSVIEEYDRTLSWLETLVPAKGRLLDFACAAGYFFERALQRGWDAHGSDLGEWAAAAAQARGLRNMHVGALADLKFPDGHFDVVYAAQVFEHLPRPKTELAELRRILKPGGLLYVDVPNYHTLPIMLGKDDFELNMPPQHINYFTPGTLSRLLDDGGFVQVRTRSNGGLKWENLVGRRINSDILAAYDHEAATDAGQAAAFVHTQPKPSVASRVKRIVRDGVVDPLLYKGMKVGMNLVAVARRP